MAQNRRNKPLLLTPKTQPIPNQTLYNPKPGHYNQHSRFTPNLNRNSPKPNYPNTKPYKTITYKEMEEKRQKWLCFWCSDKYSRDHKCKQPQLYNLEVIMEEGELEEENQEPLGGDEEEATVEAGEEEERPCISVHALNGITGYKTLRVLGLYKKQTVHILIDSGSTHNFLDINFAKRVGCRISPSEPLQVGVADGRGLMCKGAVKRFTWNLQGETFSSDVLLLSLGGCDMVLGIQWLVTLGPIQVDFKELKMVFQHMGH